MAIHHLVVDAVTLVHHHQLTSKHSSCTTASHHNPTCAWDPSASWAQTARP